MWTTAKGLLAILDGVFDIINGIWKYKFFDSEYVNTILSGAIIIACSWLVLKIVLELIMKHIVKSDSRSNPLSIFKGTILAIVMMFLITPLFTFGYKVSSELTNSVISVSGMNQSENAENTISNILVSANINRNSMYEKDIQYFLEHWRTIDINESEGGVLGLGDEYKYSMNYIMLIILSAITTFLFFFIGVQIAKRVMELALYKILAPFCCTGLTNEQSGSFRIWCKSTLGLFLTTTVQFVGIGLLLTLFGTVMNETNLFTGIFLLIGALLFVITTPTMVSSLLDHQTGITSAMGDLQSLMAVGHGVQSGIGVALSAGSSVIDTGKMIFNKGESIISERFKKQNPFLDIMQDAKNNGGQVNAYKLNQRMNELTGKNNNQSNTIRNMPNMNFNTLHGQFGLNDKYKR